MPANINPIYSAAGQLDASQNYTGAIIGPTANTNTDGTGTMYKIFQSTGNGNYIQRIRFRPVGSPAATVARVFINNGGTTGLTTTWLWDEITLPLTTLSQTAATNVYELPQNFAMPPGFALYVSFGTSTGAAGNGYSVVVIAGAY